MTPEESHERARADILNVMEGWVRDGIRVNESLSASLTILCRAAMYPSKSKSTSIHVILDSIMEASKNLED